MGDPDDEWTKDGHAIHNVVVDYFKDRLTTYCPTNPNSDLMEYIPNFVSNYQNNMLATATSFDEVNDDVFCINPDSVPGPYGITTHFYQHYWDIV